MDRPKIRLQLDDRLEEGGLLQLDQGRSHYLVSVMRQPVGAQLALFNGEDGEHAAVLERADRKGCAARVGPRLRAPAPEPGPWLACAGLKRDRVDLVAEKAAELGAERLVPLMTRNTAVTRVNTQRLRAIVREGAEQCGRLTVPHVDEALPLSALADFWPAGRRLVVLDPRRGQPLREALVPGTDAGFVIGPEGGLDDAELDALSPLPFVSFVTLGPRVLRAETAAIAALACYQALAGDWRNG